MSPRRSEPRAIEHGPFFDDDSFDDDPLPDDPRAPYPRLRREDAGEFPDPARTDRSDYPDADEESLDEAFLAYFDDADEDVLKELNLPEEW